MDMDVKNFLKEDINDGQLLDDLLNQAEENGISKKAIESELQVLSREGIIKYYYESLEHEQRITIKDNQRLHEYVG